jgi:ATP-dependent helicase/nuclease subunit A
VSTLVDQPGRDAIEQQLDRTLFVEAGAGTGKTRSLIDRVVALVMTEGVPLGEIAAVTFTEKAAAELSDRLRAAFTGERTRAYADGDADRTALADAALDDLDGAAIGTLHSFAQRLLSEHPIEAGIPPLLEVQDEVSSQVGFQARWTALRADLLEDPQVRQPLLLGLAAGMTLEQLRAVAYAFHTEWDRLPVHVLAGGAPALPDIDAAPLVARARAVAAYADHCVDADDRFLPCLRAASAWADRLAAATDAGTRTAVLADAPDLKWTFGRRNNYPGCDLNEIKDQGRALAADAAQLCGTVLDSAVRCLAHRIAQATLDGARERQRSGTLEFHDLLVLARELLRSPRHGREVRAALQQRYRRLLLDEFQDTDPIQIELACRIAAGVDGDAADWRDIPVPPGGLFVVGDPKQSIYRFRRADIATYLDAQAQTGQRVSLTSNFRSGRSLVEWVNHVFAHLIRPEPGSQPPYEPLDATRPDPDGGARIVALGRDPHPARSGADEVRRREAADVARAIAAATDGPWLVADDDRGWRPARYGDIALLVPARTSLPFLEDALDAAGIPYRAEASSLVYRTPEVRDLLMTARAVDDPSDALALVSALRSPLFGCGDDDLWTWRRAGGSFHLLAPPPEDVADDHPVHEGIAYLRRLHRQRLWHTPGQLLDRLVRDRRMLELGADGPRARDVWRRLRFVVDQARAWSDAEAGGLRRYLDWARSQGDETSRVAEAVLPETDIDAVRVMTIHAAKGLQFPIVVASGMSSRPRRVGGTEVLWPADGGYEIRLNRSVQTGDFDAVKPVDEQMDFHERLRLLYVACTRARHHLVVSLHREERARPPADPASRTSAELLAEATAGAPHIRDLPPAAPGLLPAAAPAGRVATRTPPPWPEWRQEIDATRAGARRASTVAASGLEGTAVASRQGEDPGLAKGPRHLELPPWNKGRYGTAIGRAVHGALQTADLATGAGLDDAVAAQCLAEGVADHQLVVAALCRSALGSPTVRAAAERIHWQETYVATTLPDGRVLEGFVDLVFADDDGSLVVVDYKTDAVPAEAIEARTAVYRPQMAAYVLALEDATGRAVSRAVLVFCHPEGSVDRTLSRDDLTTADLDTLAPSG